MLAVLVVLYMVLYYLRPMEWIAGLSSLSLLGIVGSIALLYLGFGVVSKKVRYVISGHVERYALGFVIAILLSHLGNGYLGGAIKSFNTFLPTITGYLLIGCFLHNQKRIDRFLLLIIGLTVMLACEGWLQHTTGFAHGGLEPLYQNVMGPDGSISTRSRIRWYGVFNDPNDFGLALVLVVPFLLSMLFQRQYIVPIIAFPPLIASIYYTDSRGTFLACIVSIAVYFLVKYRTVKGFLIGIVLGVVLVTYAPSRISSLSAEEDSAYGRIEAWYEGYQMFKESPVFGVGQGMFTDYHHLTAHNSFVQVMAELGFVGLFFFTGMFYFAYSWLWHNVISNKSVEIESSQLSIISAAYASLTGILASMFFLSRAYILMPYMILAVVISINRIVDNEKEHFKDKKYVTPHHVRNIFALTVSQIVGINLVVKFAL